MEEQPNLLQAIINPKSYKYEMTEKAFLDLWEAWGKPKELHDSGQINTFLTELMDKTNGLVIWDHFSQGNYDYISKIEYNSPFTYVYWKDNNKFRESYLKGELDSFEEMEWSMYGYATYMYTLLHINKLKFRKYKNHLYIIFRVNLIPDHSIEKQFKLKNENELISSYSIPNDLYKEYVFWEGDKTKGIKHICTVNTLPYYTGVIQPKEGNSSASASRLIMLNETLNETTSRMKNTYDTLIQLDEYDYDALFSQGNTIRRILEYTLKFFCLYQEIEMKIDQQYGHVKLGNLRKAINDHSEEIEMNQSLVNMANELSHDSGKVFSKEEILDFWEKSAKIINQIYEEIAKHQ